jgi:hypothetical protein
METKTVMDEQVDLGTREALSSRFWDFPLLVTLGLWLCIIPLVLALVGWIWGFWPAFLASFIILMVMLVICLAYCLKLKRFKKTLKIYPYKGSPEKTFPVKQFSRQPDGHQSGNAQLKKW